VYVAVCEAAPQLEVQRAGWLVVRGYFERVEIGAAPS
jgi:hypothetical protein